MHSINCGNIDVDTIVSLKGIWRKDTELNNKH